MQLSVRNGKKCVKKIRNVFAMVADLTAHGNFVICNSLFLKFFQLYTCIKFTIFRMSARRLSYKTVTRGEKGWLLLDCNGEEKDAQR